MEYKNSELGKCELCELEVDKSIITHHHLIPKQKKGKNDEENKIRVCIPCQKQIHALFSNYELKHYFNTLSKLKDSRKIRDWIKWRKKHPDICDISYSQKRY